MRSSLQKLSYCLIFLGVTLSASAGDIPQTVSLVGDPWPPYMLGELGQEASGGVGLKLMQTIFERLNSKVEGNYKLNAPMVPWKRALREVEHGSKDGIAILLKTPERETYMTYTDELFRSHNVYWYTRENFPNGFDWNTYEDLKGYSVGIIRGHSYGSVFDRMVIEEELDIVEVSSASQMFAMLNKRRVDLAIADKLVGASFAKKYQQPNENVVAAEKPAHAEIYHIAFSKKSEARKLIPAINTIISEMKSEGEIERIVQGLPKKPLINN